MKAEPWISMCGCHRNGIAIRHQLHRCSVKFLKHWRKWKLCNENETSALHGCKSLLGNCHWILFYFLVSTWLFTDRRQINLLQEPPAETHPGILSLEKTLILSSPSSPNEVKWIAGIIIWRQDKKVMYALYPSFQYSRNLWLFVSLKFQGYKTFGKQSSNH